MGLRAQVRTRDGWAIQHAVVTVTDMTGTQVLRAAADENGAVRTDEPVPAGAYTVIVTAIGGNASSTGPSAVSMPATFVSRPDGKAIALNRVMGGVWDIWIMQFERK